MSLIIKKGGGGLLKNYRTFVEVYRSYPFLESNYKLFWLVRSGSLAWYGEKKGFSRERRGDAGFARETRIDSTRSVDSARWLTILDK
jgi:hypothetical protein